MVSILLLLPLLLHCEARFRVGRNRWHTCFVVQAGSGSLRRVTIGNAITAAAPPGLLLLLLLLLLDRLQGVALVDSGHPVATFVEHLSHLASSEGCRQVSSGSVGRCAGIGTDGRRSDGAATAADGTSAVQVMCGSVGGNGGSRGFRRGNHFHFALVPLLLLALLEAHLHLCKP